MAKFVLVFLLLCVATLKYSEAFSCYDCTPDSASGCDKPTDDDIMICDGNDDDQGYTYQCLSLKIKDNENSPKTPAGIYRGCAKADTNNLLTCEQIKSILQTTTTVEVCDVCNTENCNNKDMNA